MYQSSVDDIVTAMNSILQHVFGTEEPSDGQSQTNIEMEIETSVDPRKLHNAIQTLGMYCA